MYGGVHSSWNWAITNRTAGRDGQRTCHLVDGKARMVDEELNNQSASISQSSQVNVVCWTFWLWWNSLYNFNDGHSSPFRHNFCLLSFFPFFARFLFYFLAFVTLSLNKLVRKIKRKYSTPIISHLAEVIFKNNVYLPMSKFKIKYLFFFDLSNKIRTSGLIIRIYSMNILKYYVNVNFFYKWV